VRFATECLAFANVPPASTLARMPGGSGLRSHHPGWKARAPRDLGAGWDFDDVRDHYLQRLYGLDPFELRASDHERYLALSRAVSAEVISATFGEWRRGASSCRGALVWFLRDLWAGAGWGLVDELGTPKAAYYGMKRACAPVAVFISDEGTNGLVLHLVNEHADALAAQVEVALYRDDGLCLQRSTRSHRVAARGAPAWNLGEWFDGFLDVSRAYRFGPAEHALIVATLRDAGGRQIGQAFHFPEGLPSRRERDIGLQATLRLGAGGQATIELTTRGFAQSIHFDVPSFTAEDEFFHLAPGSTRSITLRPDHTGSAAAPRGSVHALNAWGHVGLKVVP
jgi:beta-mannosidase